MPKTKTQAGRPPVEQAVMEALKAKPQASTAEIAAAAGVGRSTASKVLARLESSGEARRTEGGRDGARRLPDRWAPASAKPAAEPAGPKAAGERLKPGELDGLILGYLEQNPGEPVGPSAVAKALQRSAGATANSLIRLTRARQVREVSESPRRYTLAA